MCQSPITCLQAMKSTSARWIVPTVLWLSAFKLHNLVSLQIIEGNMAMSCMCCFWGGFDSLPTSLFCHRFDNMHWTESQQLLMEVQSVSRWTPALWLTLPLSVSCLLDGDFVRTILDALQTNRSQCYTAERNSVSRSASLSRPGYNLSYRPIRVQSNGHSVALSTLHSRLRASS